MNELLRAAGGDANLAQALALIAQDPEGSKALRAALDQGATFKVGGVSPDAEGETTRAPGKLEVAVRDPANIATLAHEIFHAGVGAPQDSKREEVLADAFGDAVSRRTTGKAGDSVQAALQQVRTAPAYIPLPESNPLLDQRMQLLGITPPANI
jgi:hypothetical protein